MGISLTRSDEDITRTIEQHSDMLFRICLIRLGNQHDAYDAVQETFIRFMIKAPLFEGSGHEKAWLIRVASNICKDMQRSISRHQCVDIDNIKEILDFDKMEEYCFRDEDERILNNILNLPDKYKAVIHLYYVEGYDVKEIADILEISGSAVKKRMQRGREMLKIKEVEQGGYSQ